MDPKFVEMAERELRETESRKSQALLQVNEWLDKHPFIKNCRRGDKINLIFNRIQTFFKISNFPDEIFLCGFLRYDKYNVDKACQRLENLYILKLKYPQYYDISDNQKLLETNLAMADAGFLYSLPERDESGRLVFVCRFGRRDPEKFSIPEIFRFFRSAVMTWSIYAETQIAGCSMIFDMADVGLKHLYSPQDIRASMDILKNFAAMRQKLYVVLNVNKFAASMIDLFKTVLSEKMKSRLHVANSNEELFEYVTPKSILPSNYGGTSAMNEAQMIEEFKKLLVKHHEEVSKIFDTEVDITKIPVSKLQLEEGEVTGSFRTLEID